VERGKNSRTSAKDRGVEEGLFRKGAKVSKRSRQNVVYGGRSAKKKNKNFLQRGESTRGIPTVEIKSKWMKDRD